MKRQLARQIWHRRALLPVQLSRSYATSSQWQLPDNIYDVVCVGGGPAGLSLLSALRMYQTQELPDANVHLGSSPVTSGLKVALIEGQDLKKSTLRNPSPASFSNRCSSLTPASVRFLKSIGLHPDVAPLILRRYWVVEIHK
jgi:ubiquinone biosynthesis monooxygenase Coq6